MTIEMSVLISAEEIQAKVKELGAKLMLTMHKVTGNWF